jgi:hypothetical protein
MQEDSQPEVERTSSVMQASPPAPPVVPSPPPQAHAQPQTVPVPENGPPRRGSGARRLFLSAPPPPLATTSSAAPDLGEALRVPTLEPPDPPPILPVPTEPPPLVDPAPKLRDDAESEPPPRPSVVERAYDEWEARELELPRPQTAPPEALRPFVTLEEALEQMRAATTRDGIGDALVDWLRSAYGCGLVLIVKGGSALGWKGFAPDADSDRIESIAMPLASPSMLKHAHDARATFRGAPQDEGKDLHTRLWKLLRCEPPREVIVAPIVLGARVVNLVYTHAEMGPHLPDAATDDVSLAANVAAEQYARLIRTKK